VYGVLFEEQSVILGPYVQGETVYDLGCGDLSLSYELLMLGAAHVVAVDKERCPRPKDPRVELLRAYFHEVVASPKVSFLSYPANYPMQGLLEILARSQTVVYLGRNTDGTACGTVAVFQHFLQRELLAYVPVRKNTMIIYGSYDPLREPRAPRGEELAALTKHRALSYDEVEVTPR